MAAPAPALPVIANRTIDSFDVVLPAADDAVQAYTVDAGLVGWTMSPWHPVPPAADAPTPGFDRALLPPNFHVCLPGDKLTVTINRLGTVALVEKTSYTVRLTAWAIKAAAPGDAAATAPYTTTKGKETRLDTVTLTSSEEMHRLRGELASAVTKLSEAQLGQKREKEKEAAALRRDLELQRAAIAGLQTQLSKLNDDKRIAVLRLESQGKEHAQEVEKLKAEAAGAAARAREELAALQRAKDAEAARAKSMEETLAAQRAQLAAATPAEAVTALQAQLESLGGELQREREAGADAAAQLKEVAAQLAQAQAAAAALKGELEAARVAAVEAAAAAAHQHREREAGLLAERDALADALQAENSKATEAAAEAARLAASLGEAEDSIARLRVLVETTETQLAQAQEAAAAAAKARDALEVAASELQAAVNQKTEEVAGLQAQVQQQAGECASLREQLAAAQAQAAKTASTGTGTGTGTGAAADTDAAAAAATASLAAMAEKCGKTAAELTITNSRVRGLQDELARVRALYARAEAEASDLRQRLAAAAAAQDRVAAVVDRVDRVDRLGRAVSSSSSSTSIASAPALESSVVVELETVCEPAPATAPAPAPAPATATAAAPEPAPAAAPAPAKKPSAAMQAIMLQRKLYYQEQEAERAAAAAAAAATGGSGGGGGGGGGGAGAYVTGTPTAASALPSSAAASAASASASFSWGAPPAAPAAATAAYTAASEAEMTIVSAFPADAARQDCARTLRLMGYALPQCLQAARQHVDPNEAALYIMENA